MTQIKFVTGNKRKFEIAKKHLSKMHINSFELHQETLDVPEIQDQSVEIIAQQSAVWASQRLQTAVITSDVGFFIESLNGFPGPYVKHVNSWLSANDILKLMEGKKDRRAYFTDAIAYCDPKGRTVVFSSITYGMIVHELESQPGEWMVDALFIPDGHATTLQALDGRTRDSVWNTDRWDKMMQYLEKVYK